MENILKEVVSKLNVKKNGYRIIPHKQGWLNFLKDGDLIFKPSELHQILRQVISQNPPRGEKLFYLRKVNHFTVTDEKEAYRPEEALERFITTSNADNFYNQVPIGGGKESIDIGIEENGTKFIFVELKPWSSTNSPLYAIVESLKNLIEYRAIQNDERKAIKRHKYFKDYDDKVDLIILAPLSYYQDYGLIEIANDKISTMKNILNAFSSEFNTNISLMALTLKKEDFENKIKKICEEHKVEKQLSISISKSDAIAELARDKWELLVSSDKK